MIAKSLGFETFDIDDLAELDVEDLIRGKSENALGKLRQRGISPTMSAEQLIKLMRDE